MRYSVWGTELEVNLAKGSIEKVQSDPGLIEAYLGGKGANAKILWDRVPPEVAPFSPENLLIVSAGALVGTLVPGANRTTITCRSPVAGLHMYSNMGGHFGAELKFAGYDRIVFTSKSPMPVYLWINDDRVELRDATHLWGKDTFETQRIIREELKDNNVQIMCIGPAGENRVYAASIEHGPGASASRGGVGAIMGDKKLKAIAVRGTKDVNVADPVRFMELCDGILSRSKWVRGGVFEGRVAIAGYARNGDYYNRSGLTTPELEKKIGGIRGIAKDFILENRDRETACYNCAQRCHHAYRRPNDNGHLYIKCTSWGAGTIATGLFDMNFTLAFYDLIEKYGLDSLAVANEVAFAIDLYQKGILTKADTGGMHLEWANADVALWLVDRIAHREGIGDVLADGVYWASKRIGKGAEEYAYYIKKYDPHPFKREDNAALCESINDKGDSTKALGSTPDAIWAREDRDVYMKSPFFPYPEELKRFLQSEPDSLADDSAGAVEFMTYNEETYTLADAMGECYFYAGRYVWPSISPRSLIAELISVATGMDISEAKATEIARRTINLVRAYNMRAGMTREEDLLPDRYFKIPRPAGSRFVTRALLNKWVDRWYELRGWTKEGLPTKSTLEKLGLDFVGQDLERRGILPALAGALAT